MSEGVEPSTSSKEIPIIDMGKKKRKKLEDSDEEADPNSNPIETIPDVTKR